MSDELRFVKMSGAGNDFVVLGPEAAPVAAGREAEWAISLCRRGSSVGADGLLLVEPVAPDRLRVRFHNPDGSSAFCANGARCAARFAHARGLAGISMVLSTAVGEVAAEVIASGVCLTLPPPSDEGDERIEFDGQCVVGRRIRAGVPHFVVSVADPRSAPLERWGPLLRRHPRFGREGTNVDLVASRPDGVLAIRTWERGVERETLACGSGAVAAAYVAAKVDAGRVLRVLPASGVPLEVEIVGPLAEPTAVRLSGEARFVFEGRLDAESFPESAGG